MQLKLDMSCHLLNVYTKFQIDISKHVEEKSGKRGRTDRRTDGGTDGRTDRRTDGQTDGRTLPRQNTSRFSNGRIKIELHCGLLLTYDACQKKLIWQISPKSVCVWSTRHSFCDFDPAGSKNTICTIHKINKNCPRALQVSSLSGELTFEKKMIKEPKL